MSSSMQAYLAAKYMSGPKADAILAKTSDKPKKKKRKVATDASTSTASFIRDDDGGWGREARDSDEEEMKDVQTGSDRTFKKKTKSNWEVVQPGEGIPEEEPPPKDEEPLVVETDDQPVFRAGLMTADQLRKVAPKKKKPTKQEMDEAAAAAAQETVYRDSSGRKIDTKAERAEAARKRREQEELEARKMEWGKGLVQREEEERRRLELEKEKTRGMARYADDADLNADQKAQDRWNDPAAAFLTTKKSKGPKKPEYKGPPPPPNRFGIKPGYRWDGVDRGNGFEKKFFQKQNERARRGAEAYEYSVDDMTNEPLSREEFVLTLGNAALGIALAFLNHYAPWRMEDVQLDTTQLLFVPGPAEHDAPTVVQVTLTSDTNPTSSETLARYHLVQSELTKLILLILIHHKSKPLPTPTKVHGEGFSLIASHRPWVYGQQWAFKWGKENILPAEDKWTFEFRAR